MLFASNTVCTNNIVHPNRIRGSTLSHEYYLFEAKALTTVELKKQPLGYLIITNGIIYKFTIDLKFYQQAQCKLFTSYLILYSF